MILSILFSSQCLSSPLVSFLRCVTIVDNLSFVDSSHELLRLSLLEDVAVLRADISKERSERIHADEDLVQAINHYAAALQDGIKIVSSQ